MAVEYVNWRRKPNPKKMRRLRVGDRVLQKLDRGDVRTHNPRGTIVDNKPYWAPKVKWDKDGSVDVVSREFLRKLRKR